MTSSSLFPLQATPTGRRPRTAEHGTNDRDHRIRRRKAISSPQSSKPRASRSPPTLPPEAAPTGQQVCWPASSRPSSPAASPERKQPHLLANGHCHLPVGAPANRPPPPLASRCRHLQEVAPAHAYTRCPHATPGAPSRQRSPAPASNHSHQPADIPAEQRASWRSSRPPPASGQPSEPAVASARQRAPPYASSRNRTPAAALARQKPPIQARGGSHRPEAAPGRQRTRPAPSVRGGEP